MDSDSGIHPMDSDAMHFALIPRISKLRVILMFGKFVHFIRLGIAFTYTEINQFQLKDIVYSMLKNKILIIKILILNS